MSLQTRIDALRSKRKMSEAVTGIGSGAPSAIRREPSSNEQQATWHKQGYFLYNCVHDKSKFTPCVDCKRSWREAEDNLLRYKAELVKTLAKLCDEIHSR
jgi:hypothetical protein